MDPNTVLTEIRHLVQLALNEEHSSAGLIELAEHVAALDQWLSGGGFLPASWEEGQSAHEADERGELHRTRFASFQG